MAMDQVLEAVREQQRKVWNRFSDGWRKWDDLTMRFLQPVGDVIIDQLHLHPDDDVLDVASGTGEPALSIAKKLTSGKVVATDLSEDMLTIAAEKARKAGIENLNTLVSDCCELHFSDGSFDKVSCRMGFMFFPDQEIAAEEMHRMLRYSGRLATSVWGAPQNNPWASVVMSVISEKMEVPPPPHGAPGLFRCADSQEMEGILNKAGFRNIETIPVEGHMPFGNFETYWQFITEVAAPVADALQHANEETITAIKQEVQQRCNKRAQPDGYGLPFQAYVFAADR